jgi:hypothetical protein
VATGSGVTGTNPSIPSGRSQLPRSSGSSLVQLGAHNSGSATYTVDAQHFTVTLATSAPCWILVSSPGSTTPIAEGVQQSGQSRRYQANSSLTVNVGSSAVDVGIVVNGKTVIHIAPKTAPFTYTFTGTSS